MSEIGGKPNPARKPGDTTASKRTYKRGSSFGGSQDATLLTWPAKIGTAKKRQLVMKWGYIILGNKNQTISSKYADTGKEKQNSVETECHKTNHPSCGRRGKQELPAAIG